MVVNNTTDYHKQCLDGYLYSREKRYQTWYLMSSLLCIVIGVTTLILNGMYLFVSASSIRLRPRIGDKLTMLLASVDLLQGEMYEILCPSFWYIQLFYFIF